MGTVKKLWLVGLLYGLAVFIFSPSFRSVINNPGFWNIKEQLLYLTGSVAMAYMVISMILSVRSARINDFAGGLDKAYYAHKWIGIWAFVFSIIHWAVKEGPAVLVALNLAPPKIKSGGVSPYSEFEKALYGFGNDMAEIAFYIIIAVLLISLFKKIPYHIFRLIHKIIPALFLVIVFHGATIQIKGQWFGSFGSMLLVAMLIIGSAAAVFDLLQLAGRSRRVNARLSKMKYDKKTGILDISLALPEGAFRYKAGQYVFLKFASGGEPHPFSIASYDKEMKEIRFLIKELGDFTKKLPDMIKVGENVIIEGAYGSFTFDDGKPRQVWIAGGIGVTPFMSRLEYLAACGGASSPVDFFFSARGESPLKPLLDELCAKAGVKFHYIDTSAAGRLNMDGIREKAGDFAGASLWYCGPSAFGDYLKKALRRNGSGITLHYDNFDMR